VNPPNAALNFLYALLESEARLALCELGLDPGIGVLHSDTKNRDSLACDLMEPVRPQVDSFVLQWLRETTLARRWFFEERNGNCRLLAGLAIQFAETSKMWRHALAPYAEGVARSLWPKKSQPNADGIPTRLTQTRKREAKGIFERPPTRRSSKLPSSCGECGVSIKSGFKYCRTCVPTVSRKNILKAAAIGRLMTHKPMAQARRADTQRRQNAALRAWRPSDKPNWLDKTVYLEEVVPKLRKVTVPSIMSAISVSEPYALGIRAGRRLPHPRHWVALARLAGWQRRFEK
jgi:CRISPR associated protein Cas1